MSQLTRSLTIAAATAAAMMLLVQPVAAQTAPDIDGEITLDSASTLPGTTVEATASFTAIGGPATWPIGLRLEGTNGAGTFTTVTPGPGVTNCVLDGVARTVSCDWSPTAAGDTATVTATIAVDPSASPLPNLWDVFAKSGDLTLNNTFLTIEATYSGTDEGFCPPVIEVTNTGTGDLTFAIGAGIAPLPVGGVTTVRWPTDADGPLAQVDWEFRIAGETTVVDSGTLALPDDCTIERLEGKTRIDTAISVSQAGFGADTAAAVVLARADLFPDGLVGGPLAAVLDGPLLLTLSDNLPDEVLTELDRVLPAGGDVHVLGGTGAVDATVEAALDTAGYTVIRYPGADRYDTATLVADGVAAAGGDTSTALVAVGSDFPDALTAAAAGADGGHPVVLTPVGGVDDATDAWLTANAPTQLVCVGGPACTSYPTADVDLVGADRYATAVAVADEFFTPGTDVGIATGENFPDALVAAADTRRRDGPLVLTRSDTLPTVIDSFIQRWNPDFITIYGGPGAVSDSVAQQLR